MQDSTSRATSTIEVSWQRAPAANLAIHPAPYLVTLDVSPAHSAFGAGAYPQSRAVVDDFGNLVCVKAWQ